MKKINKFINKIKRKISQYISFKSSKTVAAQNITFFLSEFSAAVISSLVATLIAQDLIRYNFSFFVVLVIVFFFIFSFVLQTQLLRVKLNAYFIFISMLTIIIFEGVALAFLYVSTRPPTIYLILDATEKSQSDFGELQQNVIWAANTQPDRSISGLRVYGGNLNNSDSCDSTIQLIKPIPLKDYKKELLPAISNLKPGGHASLTISVLQAVKYDLKNQRGPITLFVIASGVDEKCEPALGGIFESQAQDIKSNTRNDIKIIILSVGNISKDELTLLDRYAKAFNGIHHNINSPYELSLVLTAPQDYFSNYLTREITPITPTPQQ